MALAPKQHAITDIDKLIHRASQIDSSLRIAMRKPTQHAIVHSAPATPPVNPNAMDIGRMRLDELKAKVPEVEWNRRMKERACLNCGKRGHRLYKCLSKFSPDRPALPSSTNRVATTSTSPPTASIAATPTSTSSPEPSAPASQETVNRIFTLLEDMKRKSAVEGSASKPEAGF